MKPQHGFAIPPSSHGAAWGYLVGSALLGGILLPFAACHSKNRTPAPEPELEAPTITAAATGDGVTDLEWTLVPGAISYNVYWTDGEALDTTTADCVRELARLRHRVTGLMNGNTYCYAVSANHQNNVESRCSETHVRTLAPGMVTELSAAPDDGRVTLTWSAVHGATGYAVYRDTVPGVVIGGGERFAPVQSPYVDAGLTNGTTYYYMVTAMGPGGEGRQSGEVSARPASPAPDAPQYPAVTLMEEAPNTLVIEWQAPTTGVPDSYNLYWSNSPGVTTSANLIADVTSPYVHTGLPGRVTVYYVITAVANGAESQVSLEVSGTPRGGSGGGGGHTTTLGNNLSFPLVFADGFGVLGAQLARTSPPWLDFATGLRPLSTDIVDPFPYLGQATIVRLNEVDYYPQKTASTWQAEWSYEPGTLIPVVVDWGDNLQSAHLTAQSNIRVETILYQDTTGNVPAETMTAYEMTLLGGSGKTESYGTTGATYESNRWHVFTLAARLQIQKLQGPGGPVDPSVQGFDAAIHESFGGEGPGGYNAEINVSGKLVYGYVWMLKQWPLTAAEKAGWWRITFSLDPHAFVATTPAAIRNRVFLATLDPGETVAMIDPGANKTWIEIELQ